MEKRIIILMLLAVLAAVCFNWGINDKYHKERSVRLKLTYKYSGGTKCDFDYEDKNVELTFSVDEGDYKSMKVGTYHYFTFSDSEMENYTSADISDDTGPIPMIALVISLIAFSLVLIFTVFRSFGVNDA